MAEMPEGIELLSQKTWLPKNFQCCLWIARNEKQLEAGNLGVLQKEAGYPQVSSNQDILANTKASEGHCHSNLWA